MNDEWKEKNVKQNSYTTEDPKQLQPDLVKHSLRQGAFLQKRARGNQWRDKELTEPDHLVTASAQQAREETSGKADRELTESRVWLGLKQVGRQRTDRAR